MRNILLSMGLFFFSSFFETLASQNWLSKLPGDQKEIASFSDAEKAFDKYFKKNRNTRILDRIGLFELGELSEKEIKDFEEYNMFKRWEWFLKPRIFKQDTFSLENIISIIDTIQVHDNFLSDKQNLTESAPFLITNIWKPIGPFDAVNNEFLGRVNCILVDPQNSDIIYIGTPNGGIWKTTNGGLSWNAKFDDQATLSIADIAIDPINSNVLYAATSDGFGYIGNITFWGGTYSVGVLKSIDGGDTWTTTGLNLSVADNMTIRRIVASPTNRNILLAATNKGLYRTGDGGNTWTIMFQESCYDIEFHPSDGNIVYVTATDLWKSSNAGLSFNKLASSCTGTRFNVEVSRTNPNTLYTLCTNNVVQKSVDGGISWQLMKTPSVRLFGYYDNVLSVSPFNENIVYVAGSDMYRSENGGQTWGAVPMAGHVDNHCIQFVPGSENVVLCGNDGGLFKSTNSAATWSSLNKGLSISQLYRVALSRTKNDFILGGLQDNGNMIIDKGVFRDIKVEADGMGGFIDWSDSKIIYFSMQNGSFYRSNDAGLSFKKIPTPSRKRPDWLSPWCQHPQESKTIFAATDKIYKSTNQGDLWTPISGNLMQELFTILEVSHQNPNIIYAGNGSRIFITQNGGTTWKNITGTLPTNSNYITDISISNNDPSVCYLTFSGYNSKEKVYRTTNSGTLWTNISGSLPNIPVNCVTYGGDSKNGIYIGTDAGIYYLNDSFTDWVPHKNGMPNVIINDIKIDLNLNRMIAATYGRGIWQGPLVAL